MRILMVTPEATPFAQTGGLGEVLQALPAALVELGLEVDVVMPKYRDIDEEHVELKPTGLSVDIDLNDNWLTARFWEHISPRGVRYLFVENDRYFDREGLYGTPEGDYPDNSERFVFLSRAAIQMAIAVNARYRVFHCHDWQTSLVPVYLRTLFAGERLLHESATVLTIHNLGYQGIFQHVDMPLTGLGWELFNPQQLEFYGNLNFLKSGIVFADEVNTVSPGYRNEIMTSEFGFGLEGVLQQKSEKVTGILNGVDYSFWDPTTDEHLPARYSTDDLSGKALCKAEFQKEAGLELRPDAPLLGMVTRLSHQKGVDLVEHAAPFLMDLGVQLVLLGTGEARYHQAFEQLAATYPRSMALYLAYDNELAHRIFGASDILLVPSRYEPCGLNQLYGLRYGTVPVVRATGGLNDTVDDFNPAKDTGTGFKFHDPRNNALERTVQRAVHVYSTNPEAWKRLMIRGMKEDFSWKRSAREYQNIYQRAYSGRNMV